MPGQDLANAAKNAGFFHDNERYAGRVGTLDTYRNVRRAIDREIAGARYLLDVGNGGVFDYDTRLVERLVGVDLFLDGTPPHLADHITLRRGDALALDERDEAYDMVLEVFLLHHLVGADTSSTLANIRRALAEAHRVLEPGGRLVVVESCVSARAFAIERRLFGALRGLARTPLVSHPATLQFPGAIIARAIGDRFGNVRTEPIAVGRWILQFGVRWPVALTPARPHLFTATRV
ncbi:MAG: class I SAM-dependent methyltransferase [Solirubrobacteraceae bacterium]|jgi:SAM-dependent methyltransferase